jgi:hypothetical protein
MDTTSYGPATVCARCFEDEALRAFVAANATDDECSFCGRSSAATAADAGEVVEFIEERLAIDWMPSLDELYFDKESPSGLAGPTWDIRDVLEQYAPIFDNDDLQEFVVDALLENIYTPRHFAATSEGDALRFGWKDLVETVKHRQRFFFVLQENDRTHDGAGVPIPRGAEMLEVLGRLIDKYGLVEELPASEIVYRARPHAVGKGYTTAKDLGAPPAESASQSRMSPAGVPMLYAADDRDTAVAEANASSPSPAAAVTVAQFRLTEAMRIVDLSELPPIPSIFDDGDSATRERHELGFLHGFRRDIGAKVTHDGREHIEYVPTQVVCEYLRYSLPPEHGGPVGGVAWESVQNPGNRNVVLFLTRDQCVEKGERARFSPGPLVELVGTV